MLEWLSSIGKWFVDNKNAILITLSSIDFGALVSLLFYFFKHRKSIDANTKSTEALDKSLTSNEQLKQDLAEVKQENHELKLQVESLCTNQEILITKLNAMLDVQSIVYATIKDEPTRVAVGNILANAKYTETSTRAQLKEELASLRKQVAEQAEQLNNKVKTAIEKSESLVDNVPERIVTRH